MNFMIWVLSAIDGKVKSKKKKNPNINVDIDLLNRKLRNKTKNRRNFFVVEFDNQYHFRRMHQIRI